ncbi:MAG: cupin domain-containing protein [Phycisphaerales bacterium]
MLKTRIDPASTKPLQMDGVKDTRMEILVGRQHGAPTFSMRHFVVGPGGHTPHHQHPYEHEVIILEGEADVTYADSTHQAKAGDVLFIPANVMHQFRNTSGKDMRFLCMVPTTFDCGKTTPGS